MKMVTKASVAKYFFEGFLKRKKINLRDRKPEFILQENLKWRIEGELKKLG